MAYIVIIGTRHEQQRAVGPFETFDDADEWCYQNRTGEQTWITPLDQPEPAHRRADSMNANN